MQILATLPVSTAEPESRVTQTMTAIRASVAEDRLETHPYLKLPRLSSDRCQPCARLLLPEELATAPSLTVGYLSPLLVCVSVVTIVWFAVSAAVAESL